MNTTQMRAKHQGGLRPATGVMATVIGAGLLAACLVSHPAWAEDAAAQMPVPNHTSSAREDAGVPAIAAARRGRHAYFGRESASEDARHVADWIVDSNDNNDLPFLIVDKPNGKVFVFDPHGQLAGAAAALTGMAKGDDSAPGIGQRQLSAILPDERTTPAGRFVASLDRNLEGEEILWVDYDAAISLHRVVTRNTRERRAERLASPTAEDNRISFGCINVPVAFYEQVMSPAFKPANGIVYILPETRSPRETFGSYDVDEHARQQQALDVATIRLEGKAPGGRIIRLR